MINPDTGQPITPEDIKVLDELCDMGLAYKDGNTYFAVEGLEVEQIDDDMIVVVKRPTLN